MKRFIKEHYLEYLLKRAEKLSIKCTRYIKEGKIKKADKLDIKIDYLDEKAHFLMYDLM